MAPSSPALRPAPPPPSHGSRPSGALRPYDRPTTPVRPARPPQYSNDHRYARPNPYSVRPYAGAQRPPPARPYYRPYYTRWYVHPWYRWTYATTVVVGFGFGCDPWSPYWNPPLRAGFAWLPGVWVGSLWYPGYWRPQAIAPVGYAWVPGFWDNTVYVEGFYRPTQRNDGQWTWVDGYYTEDNTFVRGHWYPSNNAPEGYVWEPGFWDGEHWVEGFWRPRFRSNYTWVSSYYDEDGVFHSGYWAPTSQNPGHVWIPGWFDGNRWIEGYWVPEQQYQSEDVQSWTPEEGWNDGWDDRRWSEQELPPPSPEAARLMAPPEQAQQRQMSQEPTYEAPPAEGTPEDWPDDMPLGLPADIDVQDL